MLRSFQQLSQALQSRTREWTTTAAPPPFLRLPAEIRNQIYEVALHHAEPITVRRVLKGRLETLQPALASHCAVPHPAALTMTCKLFWQESPQLFYASNTFVLTCDSVQIDGDKTLQLPCDFFEQIGPSNKSALRSIIVDLGDQRYLDEAFRGALWQVSALAQLEPQMEVRCRARCIFIFTDLEHTVTMTVRDLKGSVAMLVQDIETQMSAADDFSDLWWDFEDIRQGVQDAPGIMFGRSPRGWDEWDGIES